MSLNFEFQQFFKNVTWCAKRGLIAFSNYQVGLIITPDRFNLSPSYYTNSWCYVRGISGQNYRVIPNSQVMLWAVKYMQLKTL